MFEDDWRKRYRDDPMFHRAVSMFEAIFFDCKLTPGELRAAMMLALYMIEARNPGPMTFRLESFAASLVADQRGADPGTGGRGTT